MWSTRAGRWSVVPAVRIRWIDSHNSVFIYIWPCGVPGPACEVLFQLWGSGEDLLTSDILSGLGICSFAHSLLSLFNKEQCEWFAQDSRESLKKLTNFPLFPRANRSRRCSLIYSCRSSFKYDLPCVVSPGEEKDPRPNTKHLLITTVKA